MENMLCTARRLRAFGQRRRVRQTVVILVPVLLMSGLLIFHLLPYRLVGIFPPCFFRSLTGLHCVGCGATRAAEYLLRGDLAGAFYYHPLIPLALLFAIYVYARFAVVAFSKNGRVTPWRLTDVQAVVLVIVLIGFGILRNLPFYQALFY